MSEQVTEEASTIVQEFEGQVDLDQSEIESEIAEIVSEFKIPASEAARHVKYKHMESNELEEDDLNQASSQSQNQGSWKNFEATPIDEINEEGDWNDITGEVVDLWEPSHPNMAQVGLLGDDSGVIKFVMWENDGGVPVPHLEEGATYDIQNTVSSEYKGRYSIKLTKQSVTRKSEREINQPQNDETEMEGVLVDIQPGSGLIKRCPKEGCTRVLKNGHCSEHGEVEGEFDMRIKAVLDDGKTVQNVVVQCEETEELLGKGLEEAKTDAMDALDTSVVINEIESKILGRYFSVEGPVLGRNLLANNITQLSEPSEDLMAQLRVHGVESAEASPEDNQTEASA